MTGRFDELQSTVAGFTHSAGAVLVHGTIAIFVHGAIALLLGGPGSAFALTPRAKLDAAHDPAGLVTIGASTEAPLRQRPSEAALRLSRSAEAAIVDGAISIIVEAVATLVVGTGSDQASVHSRTISAWRRRAFRTTQRE